jgi:hypothetical protein
MEGWTSNDVLRNFGFCEGGAADSGFWNGLNGLGLLIEPEDRLGCVSDCRAWNEGVNYSFQKKRKGTNPVNGSQRMGADKNNHLTQRSQRGNFLTTDGHRWTTDRGFDLFREKRFNGRTVILVRERGGFLPVRHFSSKEEHKTLNSAQIKVDFRSFILTLFD